MTAAIGPDGVPVGGAGGAPAAVRTRQGIGDPVVSAGYDVLRDRKQSLQLRISAKLAVADPAQGLGTGRNDYWLEARYQVRLGTWTPFANVGYRSVGKPGNLPLQDVPFVSAGAAYRFSPRWSAGSFAIWRGATRSGRPASEQVVLFSEFAGSPHWSLGAFAARGLTNAAPTWMAGISIEHRR